MFSLIDEGISHKDVVRTPFAFGEGSLERVGDIGPQSLLRECSFEKCCGGTRIPYWI